MRIFANGKDLNRVPVVQNEKGVYYYSVVFRNYYKPVLAEFDDAKLPLTYKKYTDGSHSYTNYNGVNIRKQNAIDFSLVAGTKITFDTKAKITKSTKTAVWAQVDSEKVKIVCEHMYDLAKVGAVVPAGGTICRVAPQSVSGVPPHLHIFTENTKTIREVILNPQLPIGTNIELTTAAYLRPNPDYEQIPKTTYTPINNQKLPKGTRGVTASKVYKYGGEYWQVVTMPIGSFTINGWTVTSAFKAT